MLRKVIGWLVVIFIVYWLVSDPSGAAAVVHNLIHWLRGAGNSLARFLSDL